MAATYSAGAPADTRDAELTPELRRIADSPAYRQLRERRNALALRLSLVMCAIYYGFVLMIAFGKETLATKLDGVITLGIPLGLAVILSAIVITGIYVRRANREFDRLTAEAVSAASAPSV